MGVVQALELFLAAQAQEVAQLAIQARDAAAAARRKQEAVAGEAEAAAAVRHKVADELAAVEARAADPAGDAALAAAAALNTSPTGVYPAKVCTTNGIIPRLLTCGSATVCGVAGIAGRQSSCAAACFVRMLQPALSCHRLGFLYRDACRVPPFSHTVCTQEQLEAAQARRTAHHWHLQKLCNRA